MMLALQSSIEDQDNDNVTFSCVNLYFMCQDGSTFKAQFKFAPYFYIGTKENTELEVDAYLRRRYEGQIANIQVVSKEDLGLVGCVLLIPGSSILITFI
jgi:DNA polymerase epsilon subunit 1